MCCQSLRVSFVVNMETWSFDIPLLYWPVSMGISLLCFAVATTMELRERQKRESPDHTIPTKYLSVFSYLCIAMAPINAILGAAAYVPGLCVIASFLRAPGVCFQIVVMECYQLSRLYYCFSRDQVHSDKGYPKWVFVVLFKVLILWFCSAVSMNYSVFNTECRITTDGTARSEGLVLFPLPFWALMIPICLYSALEITTMSLFWYKVHSINSLQRCQHSIRDRIQSILHRVLILTYFYVAVNGLMLMLLYIATFAVEEGLISINPFWMWLDSLNSLSISLSMFMMQDHNTSEYIIFLQFIKRYKCTLCFCCFGPMVDEQYRMLIDNADDRKVMKMVDAPTFRNNLSPTYKNNSTGMEMSIATQTMTQVEL